MTTKVCINTELIIQTLQELQQAGRRGCEGMLVWLGCREGGEISVAKIYVPEHEAGPDFFWIAPTAMATLMRELRAHRLMIAAQVHTHPHEAFHSAADDRWAIVRHEGALSLVLPEFGMRTTLRSFQADTAVFKLSAWNEWREVAAPEIQQHYLITP